MLEYVHNFLTWESDPLDQHIHFFLGRKCRFLYFLFFLVGEEGVGGHGICINEISNKSIHIELVIDQKVR